MPSVKVVTELKGHQILANPESGCSAKVGAYECNV